MFSLLYFFFFLYLVYHFPYFFITFFSLLIIFVHKSNKGNESSSSKGFNKSNETYKPNNFYKSCSKWFYKNNSFHSKKSKGNLGEKEVFNILDSLPLQNYKVLNDITIQSSYGMTQIDHIVISSFGIFVIETKNFSGNISGTEFSEQWCQNIYGEKTFFHNPMKQNYAHIKALQDVFSLSENKFIPIIAFTGNGEINIKTNKFVVHTNNLLDIIYSKKDVIFFDDELTFFFNRLLSLNISSFEGKQQHLNQVKDKVFDYNMKIANFICPRCGSKLVERNSKDSNNSFIGCSNYPKCKFTYNFDKKRANNF